MELNRPFLVIQTPFNFLRSPLTSEKYRTGCTSTEVCGVSDETCEQNVRGSQLKGFLSKCQRCKSSWPPCVRKRSGVDLLLRIAAAAVGAAALSVSPAHWIRRPSWGEYPSRGSRPSCTRERGLRWRSRSCGTYPGVTRRRT